MARLPQPGGDNGNWGTILNEYLSQTLASNGAIKDNAITSNTVAPGAITSAKIATDAVGSAQIADGSITNVLLADGTIAETKLDNSVQTKLNQAVPAWSTLSGKPTIIAAGSDQSAARLSIGVDAEIAAWAGADAYIDFSNKPNGNPPPLLDSGQPVTFTLSDGSGWKSQISSGKLIRGTLPVSGSYADYYQAQLDGDCRSFGTRYTVDGSDGSSTNGTMCIAVWANIFAGAGNVVPKTPAHITIDTVNGAWAWWVSDGGGTGSSHLKAVKTGTFTPPASDGVTVWECAGYIDPDNGISYLYLPGNDVSTGNRYVTVTDAELAVSLTAQSVPITTFAATLSGATIVMVEHFASTAANTARYPRFLNMWGETLRLARDRRLAIRQRASSSAAISYKRYHPTTTTTKTPTTSFSDIDATNAVVSATAGPSGKILFEVDCYLEFTGTDLLFMRFNLGATSSVNEVVAKGVSGDTQSIHHTFEITGLTPGSTGNWKLQYLCQNAVVTMKIGGSGGFSTVPALYIKATPL